MNGPFDEMARILLLIREFRVDCILVYPGWPAVWSTEVEALPGPKEPLLLEAPKSAPLFSPGVRVPSSDQGRAFYKCFARLVVWPAEEQAGNETPVKAGVIL